MNAAAVLFLMLQMYHPNGYHVMAGPSGVLVRMAPSLTAGCYPDGHTCLSTEGKFNVRGVVQPDPPVLNPTGGWYWVKILWSDGWIGWSRDYEPYVVEVTPPTMNMGVDFRVSGDYLGPPLTGGDCIADGLKIAEATLEFTSAPPYVENGISYPRVQGKMRCPWGANTSAGNHIAVIVAKNKHLTTGALQTASSSEFQFVVAQSGTTLAPPPATPASPRVVYTVK